MKYIRTKDGIYEHKLEDGCHLKRLNKFGFIGVQESEIIKQADTIEELCDAVVIISLSFNSCWVTRDKIYFTKAMREVFEWEHKVHGGETFLAIFNSERGLFSVAKFNSEKGEFELL